MFLNNDVAATEHGWLETLTDAVETVRARRRQDPVGRPRDRRRRSSTRTSTGGASPACAKTCSSSAGSTRRSRSPPTTPTTCCASRRAPAGSRSARPDVGLLHRDGATADTPPDNPNVEAASRANHQRYQERVRALVTKEGATTMSKFLLTDVKVVVQRRRPSPTTRSTSTRRERSRRSTCPGSTRTARPSSCPASPTRRSRSSSAPTSPPSKVHATLRAAVPGGYGVPDLRPAHSTGGTSATNPVVRRLRDAVRVQRPVRGA